MKKFFYILFFIYFIALYGNFGIHKTFANENNSCQISSGPISELNEYKNRVEKELSQILSSAGSNSCQNGDTTMNARLVFDMAYADLNAMDGVITDFSYNTQVAFKTDTPNGVRRDAKFFDQIEKRVEQAAQQLAAQCALSREKSLQLKNIIQEAQLLKRIYQKTAIGNAPTNFSGIRNENLIVANAISKAYSPNQTVSCVDNSKTQKSFLESIKSALNMGASKEEAFSTWRKAIALLKWGWQEMSPSEYAARQRALLSEELSRQWLSSNAKKIILQNFDCYKSKTLFADDPIKMTEARSACLSFPIAGTEKIFALWDNFINSATSSDDYIEREKAKILRQTRTVNIAEMHNHLVSLTSSDQDDNALMMKNLVDWHISLQLTNELLESRLPSMQKNCMKWQPNIEGGCKS